MKRALFFLFVLLSPALPAQTAAEVEEILSARTVSFAQASRFVLVVADQVEEAAGTEAAYTLALSRGWLPRRISSEAVSPDSPIRLGEACFLIVEAFGIKGSFLYNMFPGPHYAFRELDYLRLIPGQRDPDINISGERFLQILGLVAAYVEAERGAAEEPPPGMVAAAEEPEEAPVPEAVATVEAPPAPEPVAAAEAPEEPPAPKPVAAAEAPEEAPPPEAVATVEAPVPEAVAATEAPEEPPAPKPVAAAETPEKAPAPAAAAVPRVPERPPAPAAAERPARTLVAEEYGVIGLGSIQFMSNSAELQETEKARLRDMAAALAAYPDRKVLLGGYTALAGNMNERLRISMERARAVADFLVSLDACRPEEIIIQTYGAQRPAGNNFTVEGMAANRRVEVALLNEAYYHIRFMPDSAKLTETGKAKLRELAVVLSRYPGVDLLVEGHTALAGNTAGRTRISTLRARAVANFLISLDARNARKISVRGYGAARPLGDNATEAGRAMNRRVEITLLDE